LPLVDQFTSHLRDDQIPPPSDLWRRPLNHLTRNKPYATNLRSFFAMARRLRGHLKQSSTYAVSLATVVRKKQGRTHVAHLRGSMRIALFLSSGPTCRAANPDPMKALPHE